MADKNIVQNELQSPDYIFKKIFRKVGPRPLRFSSRSAKANSKKRHHACQQNQKPLKRRKVYEATALDSQICVQNSAPPKKHGKGKGLITVIQASNVNASYSISSKKKKTKREQTKQKGSISKTIAYHQLCNQHSTSVQKHGKGKGLMAVLQLTNCAARNFPMSVNFTNGATCPKSLPELKKQPVKEKKKRMQRKPVTKTLKKPQDKKKPLVRRKLEPQKPGILKQQRKEKCELVIQGERCREHQNRFSTLLDDEEMELRELQTELNPPTCSAHFASNPVHGCSFCKDLLAKFPPNSVVTRQPLYMQPWDSSPELVKKLFKISVYILSFDCLNLCCNFLCTYAARIPIHSFTFDEFALAFHDKDSLLLGRTSLLLGRTNMTLLRVLLSDVEMELSNGFIPHVIKNSKFLRLLHWFWVSNIKFL
ncbi:hypothetical protein POM88_025983 [Heracleum sosnowskyi]|uniref:DDT domain-containing protein n=1 Tax=Heracleum sosnowskyi TaxID=360622 RepID=A0AAD8I4Z9_9APIA|nr:hypothetical protein POM88_025983 [Heracleum sosnowskyi]